MESSDQKPARFGFFKEKKPTNDIYLQPEAEHKFTLIWMHGLGDSAEGFLDFFYSPKPALSNNVFSKINYFLFRTQR